MFPAGAILPEPAFHPIWRPVRGFAAFVWPVRAKKELLMGTTSLVKEFTLFLKENKKLWLLPIVLTLLLLGAILVYAESSALAPFIYTIF
jgi:hypothetical protein